MDVCKFQVSVSKFISTLILLSFQFRAHAERNFIFARDLERERRLLLLSITYYNKRARAESVINTTVLTAFCTIGNIPCEAQVKQAESTQHNIAQDYTRGVRARGRNAFCITI
jgi:hypothetical protein